MFQSDSNFDDYYQDKQNYYRLLSEQLKQLLSIEGNAVTNMAQVSAFIFQMIPELNWSGFYLNRGDDTLLLGPYQGRVACVHIPFGRGVCGTVAKNRTSLRIDNVHEFDGHIACDAASNAEIVVPIIINNDIYGVLDIDSPVQDRFDDDDLRGFEKLVEVFIESTSFE